MTQNSKHKITHHNTPSTHPMNTKQIVSHLNSATCAAPSATTSSHTRLCTVADREGRKKRNSAATVLSPPRRATLAGEEAGAAAVSRAAKEKSVRVKP